VGVQSWRASSGHEVVVGVEIKSGAELQGASRLTTTRAQPHKPCTVATTEAFVIMHLDDRELEESDCVIYHRSFCVIMHLDDRELEESDCVTSHCCTFIIGATTLSLSRVAQWGGRMRTMERPSTRT
jgi:hypothetical protein